MAFLFSFNKTQMFYLMKEEDEMRRLNLFFLIVTSFFLITTNNFAHCDGIDGPVVISAKKALETKDVDHVLIWIQEPYEDEIKAAFEKTLAVREQSPEAEELVDKYFFETLVRLHRLGEGASYTGLKPAGRDLGPAIRMTDESIESESLTELYKLLTEEIHKGLHHFYQDVINKKNFDVTEVGKGREFVVSYVKFMHYTEEVFKTAQTNGMHDDHISGNFESHKH